MTKEPDTDQPGEFKIFECAAYGTHQPQSSDECQTYENMNTNTHQSQSSDDPGYQ